MSRSYSPVVAAAVASVLAMSAFAVVAGDGRLPGGCSASDCAASSATGPLTRSSLGLIDL